MKWIAAMLKRVFLGFSLVAMMVAVPASASAMSLSFSWGPTKKCFDSKSPPMTISKVPKGTVKLKIKMADLNSSYNHGGGTVKYKGSGKLPYGAFRYKGPCPPSPHTYKFTVRAVDAKGKTLAKASAKKRFSK